MANFYIDAYAGSDFGVDHSTFTDGAFLATTGTYQNQLTKTGAFSGLNAGNLIRLQDNGSGDVVTGTYEIAVAVSADVIALTSDITGGATETVTDVKAEAHDASISKPYGGVQTFLSDSFTIAANDIIYIGNDKECKNRSGTTWSWSNVTTSNQQQAISMRAYAPGNSGGAAFVKTRADGTTTPIAKINGNGNSYITGTGTSGKYCGFVGIEFYNTTNWLIYSSHGWSFVDCKFHDGTGSYLVFGAGQGNAFINCEFDGTDTGSSTAALYLNFASTVHGSYFHDFNHDMIDLVNSTATISFNLFENIGISAIKFGDRDYINIEYNTFIGTNDNVIGLWIWNAGSYQNHIRHNIFADFGGTGTNPAGVTGGTGIYIEPNSNCSILGPNAFYNNTNDVDNDGGYNPMLEFTNVSLSSDPFVDASAGDYALDTGSDAFASTDNMTLDDSETKLSYGAVQQVQAGGGGGQTSHVSVGG
jgi:hypothetical protein